MSAQIYAEFDRLRARPRPFSVMTTPALWADPHIARQRLAFHPCPETSDAARRHDTIDAFITWVDARLGLAGRHVTNLGSGPNLHVERMARRGAIASGGGFVAPSISNARRCANRSDLSVAYAEADELTAPSPVLPDIIFMIYGDYCALAPDQRAALLRRVRTRLAPGGHFVFDVHSPGQMAMLAEGFDGGLNYGNGFWSQEDYFAFRQTHLWADERISLEHYLVATAERQFEIFNWMQYFTPATIGEELALAGFAVEALLEFDTGFAWQGGATPLTLIARPL